MNNVIKETLLLRILRDAIRLYTKNSPYPRGKEGLIRAFHNRPFVSFSPQRTKVDQSFLMDLDLSEYIQRSIYYYGSYEPASLNVFKQHVQPGMVVVDCGANVGLYSLVAASCVGIQGIVHAFEPVPETFKQLKKNVELNHFIQIVTNEMALLDTAEETCEMFISQDNNQGANSLKPTTSKLELASFTVQATTLDSYFRNTPRLPGFIKLDVEGAELLVLRGARNIIETAHPMLLLEVSAENNQAFGYTPQELLSTLKSWNYMIYEIQGANQLIPLNDSSNVDCVNVFCKPCF